jgi:protein-tyrosine phosphatase
MTDLLFVCTGNRCRSPVADALAWRSLRDRGIEAKVASAGILEGGAPLPTETMRVLSERGIECGERRSVQITPELLAESSLIVGMDRSHVREVVVLDGEAWPRTFTLKEAVRRAHQVGPRHVALPFSDWAVRLGEGREPSEMLGASSQDDIDDPIGAPYAAHERTAEIIGELVDDLIDLAWPDGVG